MKLLLLFAFLFALLLTAPAFAAGDEPGDFPAPPPGVSAQLQEMLGNVLKSANSKAAPASTRFTPTGKPLFADELLRKTLLAAGQEELFHKVVADVIKGMETGYTENGYETNDLGVALAALLEVCYELDQGTFQFDDPDKPEQHKEANNKTGAVVRQMQRALSGAPTFKALSDKSKQLAYEACTFTIGYMAGLWQQADKDADKQKAVRQLARRQLENLFHFDPDAITRNAAGEFIPTKKSGENKPDTAKADSVKEPEAEISPKAPQGVGQAFERAIPAGWKEEHLANGVLLLTPTDLAAGETIRVVVYPLQSLAGKPIEAWLTEAIARDPLQPGKPAAPAEVKVASSNFASGTIYYTVSSGSLLLGMYLAEALDRENARLVRVLASDPGVLARYQNDINKISVAALQADKKTVVEAWRGLDIEKVPTTLPDMSPGGKLEPGIYTGTRIYEEKVKDRYRLYLYPNGQYRLFNEEGRQLNNNVSLGYKYDPRTGKLDMDSGILYDMMNHTHDLDDSICLYGRDAEGMPYVYAHYNRGFGYATTTLRYAGPLDKPSPQEEADQKAQAEAEAKRYKWVVPPGQGLKPSQIVGILHNAIYRSFYNSNGMNSSVSHDLYLLLADGTVYNGLPVAPDEIDVSRSHRNEPEKWGHWKRAGTAYLAAWPDAPNQYKPLKGVLVKPGAKGTKLAGRFGASASSSNAMSDSYHFWGVTFEPEARFRKDSRGGYSSSKAQSGDNTETFIQSDDTGSSSSFSGHNVGVNTSTKKKPGGDRSGTYSVEGYTLILRYEDGRVARLPFFFEDANQDALWFEGALLSLDKDNADKNKARTK